MRFPGMGLRGWNSGGRLRFTAVFYRRLLSFSAALLLVMATGCVISPRRDGIGTGGGGTPPPVTGAGKLYVSNRAAGTIVRFDNALAGPTTGNLTPNAIIQGASTSEPLGMALDTVNNRLYVTVVASVQVYDQVSTRTGAITADRVINGFNLPSSVALDRGRDLLYVADLFNVQVVASASTASGPSTVVRTITPLVGGVGFEVAGMLFDTTADRLYLLDSTNNAVNILNNVSGLNGAIEANRSLSGLATLLSSPQGVQIDSLGRLVVANNASGRITIYGNAATVTGNTAPVATLSSAALSGPFNIVVTSGNELYVADGTAGSIPIFSGINTASGAVTPARIIAGSNTTLTRTTSTPTAVGIVLDAVR